MRRPTSAAVVCCIALVILVPTFSIGQTLSERPQETISAPKGPPKAPNSHPVYQQLRNVGLSGESVATRELVLKRDAGTFTFHSGTLYFLAPVEGKVTGAVFVGNGTFELIPPIASEKRSLAYLTKEPKMTEEFSELALRFTDATYEEVKRTTSVSSSAPDGHAASLLNEQKEIARRKVHYNVEARLLEDVLSPEPGGYLIAFIKGKKYDSKLVYTIDPHGVSSGPTFVGNVDGAIIHPRMVPLQPEEVALYTYDENRLGVWASFHYSTEYANGGGKGTEQNKTFKIENQDLDTQIEKSGEVNGKAVTTFNALVEGVRAVAFDLFPTLNVSAVTAADGEQLDFIQEDKGDDPDFVVILPKPLSKGQKFTIASTYGGKHAVTNEGNGNYYPIARDDWYPSQGFGNYSNYHLMMRIPKGLKMVATGTPIKELNEGNENISEWKSEAPQAVAGFNFGKFKRAEIKGKDYLIESYANENPPDWAVNVQRAFERDGISDRFGQPGYGTRHAGYGTIGTLSTVSLINKPLAEADMAMRIYTDFFGPVPYKRMAMTQQTACTYGQAWPALAFIPICAFYDTTVRHQFGLDHRERGYWTVVDPHEVAHQWWGHAVGMLHSYRDQWMSEGFADFSASLFLQAVYQNEPQRYLRFWEDEREMLTERNKMGFRAIDVGPLTEGYRLNNSKTGFNITRELIYPKGAYVLHMVRMMFFDPRTGDERFKTLMREFVKAYYNQPASTEDFKAMVEKHMTREMDLTGNHKMDWFFDEYVYGTELPNYSLNYSFDNGADGNIVLTMKITQANVSDNFRMPVPLYVELASGKIVRLGSASIIGNTSIEQKIPLNGLKERPRRAMLNYYYDVLATEGK